MHQHPPIKPIDDEMLWGEPQEARPVEVEIAEKQAAEEYFMLMELCNGDV